MVSSIVNDLGINMLGTTKDRKTRPFWSALHFSTDTTLSYLTCRMFFLCFSHPVVTPTIILWSRVLLRPCKDLSSFASLRRATSIVVPLRCTSTLGCNRRRKSPLGPLTSTWLSSVICTSTPGGTTIGTRPIRDIVSPFLIAYQTKQSTSPPTFSARHC